MNTMAVNMSKIWEELPEGILSVVLSKTPFRSLVRFRAVSKRWKSVLVPTAARLGRVPSKVFLVCKSQWALDVSRTEGSDSQGFEPTFVRPKDVDILVTVASEGGLLCMSCKKRQPPFAQCFLIWNPVTRQYRLLDSPISRFSMCFTLAGLVVDSAAGSYKFVLAEVIDTRSKPTTFVYDSLSSSWKRLTFTSEQKHTSVIDGLANSLNYYSREDYQNFLFTHRASIFHPPFERDTTLMNVLGNVDFVPNAKGRRSLFQRGVCFNGSLYFHFHSLDRAAGYEADFKYDSHNEVWSVSNTLVDKSIRHSEDIPNLFNFGNDTKWQLIEERGEVLLFEMYELNKPKLDYLAEKKWISQDLYDEVTCALIRSERSGHVSLGCPHYLGLRHMDTFYHMIVRRAMDAHDFERMVQITSDCGDDLIHEFGNDSDDDFGDITENLRIVAHNLVQNKWENFYDPKYCSSSDVSYILVFTPSLSVVV